MEVTFVDIIESRIAERNQKTQGFSDFIGTYTDAIEKSEKARVAEIRSQAEVSRLTQQVEHLTIVIAKFKAEAHDAEGSKETIINLESANKELKTENVTLYKELSDCNKARLSLQEANDVLGRTNVTQTETIENLERDRKALAANKDTMVQEKESLNKELAMLRGEVDAVHTRNVKLEEDYNMILARCMKLVETKADQMNESLSGKPTKFVKNVFNDVNAQVSPLSELEQDSVIAEVPTASRLTITAHVGDTTDVAYAANATNVCTVGNDKKVKVWDILSGFYGSGSPIWTAAVPQEALCCAYGDSDQILAVGVADAKCHLFNPGSNKHGHILSGHSGKILSTSFFPSVRKIATASADKTVKIFDLKKGFIESSINVGSACNACSVSGTGLLAVGDAKARVSVFDTGSLELVNTFPGHRTKITSVNYSPDDQLLAIMSRDNKVTVMDLRKGDSVLHTLSHRRFKNGLNWSTLCFSPGNPGFCVPLGLFGACKMDGRRGINVVSHRLDGRYISAGGHEGDVFVWNVATGEVETICDNVSGIKDPIAGVSWSPSGNGVVSVAKGTLTAWI